MRGPLRYLFLLIPSSLFAHATTNSSVSISRLNVTYLFPVFAHSDLTFDLNINAVTAYVHNYIFDMLL